MNIIFVCNIVIIILFFFFIIFDALKFINYKKNKLITEDIIAIINKPKELTYVESLSNKFLLATIILSIVITIITISMTEISKNIIPLYLPMILINLWYMSYESKLGFIIAKIGLKVRFQFIKWDKIKGYNWISHKKEHNKVILKIKRNKPYFPVIVEVNKGDKSRVETLLQKGLERI